MFPVCVVQEEGAEDIIHKEGVVLAGSLTVWTKVDLTQLGHDAPFPWEKKQHVVPYGKSECSAHRMGGG